MLKRRPKALVSISIADRPGAFLFLDVDRGQFGPTPTEMMHRGRHQESGDDARDGSGGAAGGFGGGGIVVIGSGEVFHLAFCFRAVYPSFVVVS